jgi:hypothetical protein
MTLDGFTYGLSFRTFIPSPSGMISLGTVDIYFLLSIQACIAVYNGTKTTRPKLNKWREFVAY